MTDLEITKLCAEAMGLRISYGNIKGIHVICAGYRMPVPYDPLRNDAQAMALVKRFELNIGPHTVEVNGAYVSGWEVTDYTGDEVREFDPDLNRAICEAVARMQKASTSATA